MDLLKSIPARTVGDTWRKFFESEACVMPPKQYNAVLREMVLYFEIGWSYYI